LAKAIDVPRRRINEIVQGNRAITADTAARLVANPHQRQVMGILPQNPSV